MGHVEHLFLLTESALIVCAFEGRVTCIKYFFSMLFFVVAGIDINVLDANNVKAKQ